MKGRMPVPARQSCIWLAKRKLPYKEERKKHYKKAVRASGERSALNGKVSGGGREGAYRVPENLPQKSNEGRDSSIGT